MLLAISLNAKTFAGDESFQLVATFSLPGKQTISAFDISTVDADAGIYAFSDRNNASVDVFALNDNEFVDGVRNPNFPNQISLAFGVSEAPSLTMPSQVRTPGCRQPQRDLGRFAKSWRFCESASAFQTGKSGFTCSLADEAGS